MAVKLLAIRFARSSRHRCLRTFHHPGRGRDGMTRRLGFVEEDRHTLSPRD